MSASSSSPITKLWYMTLKPPTTPSALPFQQIWAEILAFVRSASGPVSSGHTLWQDLAHENSTSTSISGDTTLCGQVLVMLSGYPSLESNLAADRTYVQQGFLTRMTEFVAHGRLVLVERDVNSLPLPIDAEILRIEIFSEAPGDVSGGVGGNGEGEELVEGFEIGKGGVRERKIWLRLKALKEEEVEVELEKAMEVVREKEMEEKFQTVWLRRIME